MKKAKPGKSNIPTTVQKTQTATAFVGELKRQARGPVAKIDTVGKAALAPVGKKEKVDTVG